MYTRAVLRILLSGVLPLSAILTYTNTGNPDTAIVPMLAPAAHFE